MSPGGPARPGKILACSLLWLLGGVAAVAHVLPGITTAAFGAIQVVGILLGVGFVYVGARTLSGLARDTRENGIGSLGLGAMTLVAALIVALLEPGRIAPWVFLLTVPPPLVVAGLLALASRREYLAWRGARSLPPEAKDSMVFAAAAGLVAGDDLAEVAADAAIAAAPALVPRAHPRSLAWLLVAFGATGCVLDALVLARVLMPSLATAGGYRDFGISGAHLMIILHGLLNLGVLVAGILHHLRRRANIGGEVASVLVIIVIHLYLMYEMSDVVQMWLFVVPQTLVFLFGLAYLALRPSR